MTVEVHSNGTETTKLVTDVPAETLKDTITIESKQEEKEQVEDKLKETTATLGSIIEKNSSFREESNFLTDLKEHEKKALFELRSLIETNLFELKEEKDKEGIDRETTLWGVPLMPGKCPEKNNVVLLKFLRARDFKVKDAYKMLEKTLQWRKDSKINSILDETTLGENLHPTCFMNGTDRENRPVCYNILGAFKSDETYERAFGSDAKKVNFLRWRVQLMEKGIKELEFGPGRPVSFVQVIDLKDAPSLAKKEIRVAMKEAVELLQDNYPEFVAKNIFINVPFWHYAFSSMILPFLTQRTRSKFVLARPLRATETLIKYIAIENIPVSYGGFKRDDDSEFSGDDCKVLEQIVKSNSLESIEIPSPETGMTLIWDLTVLGWDVNYKEEFVPSDEGSYTILIQKARKMNHEDKSLHNSFKSNEPGKVVLTIENCSYKKKKAFYRYKTKYC